MPSNSASAILENIGGKENIRQFTHCATRLRFVVQDDSKVDYGKLDAIPDVIAAQKANGQVQVIVGGKVVELFDQIRALLPDNLVDAKMVDEQPGDAVAPSKRKNPVALVVDTISTIFAPILPVLVGCGLAKALLSILVASNAIPTDGDLYAILSMLGDLVFYFMPFLLAVSTAEKFKTNKYLALIVTGMLMSKLMINAVADGTTYTLFGFDIPIKDYSSTVVPAILSTIVLSYLYKLVNRILPVVIRSIFTPVITLLIITPIVLLVTGPIGYYLGVYVAEFITGAYSFAGLFGPFILGLLRSPLTVLGLHYSIGPIQVTTRLPPTAFRAVSKRLVRQHCPGGWRRAWCRNLEPEQSRVLAR